MKFAVILAQITWRLKMEMYYQQNFEKYKVVKILDFSSFVFKSAL